MPARPLTRDDRAHILAGVRFGESCSKIAAGLGRCESTIYRELAANGGRRNYCPDQAHEQAAERRARPKEPKLVSEPGLAGEVEERLRAGDSPKRISIELAREGRRVSHETIYQAIYTPGRGLPAGLGSTLRLGRKQRKRRGSRVRGSNSLGIFCTIHDRPAEALDRLKVGHIEGDLIVGKQNQSALITLFDRASRRLWLGPTRSKKADDVKDGLCALLARIPPEHRLSLAWDQGSELARHREIWAETGMHIYIADPKSPWQRPTNENGNGLVRHYVGNGTDLSGFSRDELLHIEDRINTLPRKLFGWDSAIDKYDQLIAMTD